MTASYSYVLFFITFAIQPPGGIYNPLASLFYPLQPIVWILLSGTFVLAAFVILLLKFYPSNIQRYRGSNELNRATILNMIAVYFGGPVPLHGPPNQSRLPTFIKILFVVWSASCLVLRGSYQGALYDLLRRDPLDTSINTFRQVVNSDCDIHIVGFASFQLTYLNVSMERQVFSFTYHDFHEITRFLCRVRCFYEPMRVILGNLSRREITGALYAPVVSIDYFNSLNRRNRALRKMEDFITMMPVVWYFRKNTVRIQAVNEEFMRYSENGIIEFYFRKFRTAESNHQLPQVLDFGRLYGIMQACAMLLVVDIFIFILELLSTKFMSIRRLVEFFTF